MYRDKRCRTALCNFCPHSYAISCCPERSHRAICLIYKDSALVVEMHLEAARNLAIELLMTQIEHPGVEIRGFFLASACCRSLDAQNALATLDSGLQEVAGSGFL